MGEKVWCKRERAFDRVVRTIWEFLCTWGVKYGGGMVFVIVGFAYPIFMLLGGSISTDPDEVMFVTLSYVAITLVAYMALMVMGGDCEERGKYRSAIVFISLFGLLAGVQAICIAVFWTAWISLVIMIPVVLLVVGSFLHEMCELEKSIQMRKDLDELTGPKNE